MKKSVALSLAALIFMIGGFISFLLKQINSAIILSIAGIFIYMYKKFKKEII